MYESTLIFTWQDASINNQVLKHHTQFFPTHWSKYILTTFLVPCQYRLTAFAQLNCTPLISPFLNKNTIKATVYLLLGLQLVLVWIYVINIIILHYHLWQHNSLKYFLNSSRSLEWSYWHDKPAWLWSIWPAMIKQASRGRQGAGYQRGTFETSYVATGPFYVDVQICRQHKNNSR